MWVFALILAWPLIEIGLFVTLGGALGLWLTLAFVLGSALLGVSVLRRGAAMRQPGSGMMQLAGNGLSAVAAILLILPGFLTSFLGLLLLLPIVQRGVIALFGQRLAARGFVFQTAGATRQDVIEGEFTVVPEPRDDALPPSKWTQH
jgi:UPF0716 protein FxsA